MGVKHLLYQTKYSQSTLDDINTNSDEILSPFSIHYTSDQRYGITTTKWHLREFDRYLLFLVVCSNAERNTVDFIDP